MRKRPYIEVTEEIRPGGLGLAGWKLVHSGKKKIHYDMIIGVISG